MLDYWLWRRRIRIETAATFWTATLFALPGFVAALWVHPVTLNTIDGFALFWHGAGAGAGLGAGLAFALRGVFREAPAEWVGVVLGLLLAGGAAAIHVNADQREAERTLVAARVLDPWPSHGTHENSIRKLALRSVQVDWQGTPRIIAVDRDLALREESVLLLWSYEGRLGFRVIERLQRVEPRER
jgi:hypothetical protein